MLLPSYLHSPQDLSSIFLTCRPLYRYSTCSYSSPTLVQAKRLIGDHEHTCSPHPLSSLDLFTSIKARKPADRAVGKARLLLPSRSSQDLSSVLLTRRSLYSTGSYFSSTPNQLRRLVEDPESGLHPQPHLFIAIKARRLADWATEKAHLERRETLAHAIKAGPTALLELALEIEPLSLSDCLRASWIKKMVLDPIIKELDLECGQGVRKGGRRDAAKGGSGYFEGEEPNYVEGSIAGDDEGESMITVCEDIGLAILNYWIYCDLFHHTIVPPTIFSPETADATEPLSDALRLDWLHYCVPDNNDKFVEPQGEYQQLDLWQFLPCFSPKICQALAKDGFADGSAKQVWFYTIASHLGLASLKLLVPAEDQHRFPQEIQRLKSLMEDKEPDKRFLGAYVDDSGNIINCAPSPVYLNDGGGDLIHAVDDCEGEDISWVSLGHDVMICFEWT